MRISKDKNFAFFLILIGILFIFIIVAFTYYMHMDDKTQPRPINEYRIDGSGSM